ncbi:hypothetical protein L1987_46460 [Smallanthus sonchifolius]|uniref:Uncharacterized protein n=1 Tax=Smallanthus sonchifolius TaxID=185202 RepID=A0ACB9FZM4_9ASTR|nr:hypothetical protein L1987_46460 [Smallanthus sonchifolius]
MGMATTLDDIHPDIIQTHILPRLDGPSLSTTATASSYLNTLCSDDTLWSKISQTTWPSITHPRVDDVISTFPAGHRSFFDDSFPTLITHVNPRNPRRSWATSKNICSTCHLDRPSHTFPAELISAVDIRYQNDIVFSKVKFTQITDNFISSAFAIETTNNADPICTSGTIDLTVDEIAGADQETLSHLKECLTLNWILIEPTRKRACNLSSVKPYSARQDWVTNETVIRYVTVLPGCSGDEIVQCKIQVVLGVGEKGVGLYVKEVVMKLQDLDSVRLNGGEFLGIVEGVIMGGKNVRRKVVEGEERWKSYMEFKEVKRQKKEWERKKETKRELVIYFNYVLIFVSFFFCVYFFYLLL